MRLEWDADNPAIRQMFAVRMMPDTTKELAPSSLPYKATIIFFWGVAR
jgi:hypothetical protein